MHTIKIFLGSSITELHYERLHLGDYLMNSVRPIFKNDVIEIEVLKCEDIRSGNTGTPPQNKIDKLLRKCDISVFLFKGKAGEMTVHEFDVARKLQKRKRHEIYVFCFDMPEAEKSTRLIDFQKRLNEENFYWYTCKDIADLESQFILGLLKYERQLLEIKSASTVAQKSIMEKDGDARFAEYEQNEQKQSQLREQIHQDIDKLVQQIKTVMADKGDTVAAKIVKVIKLYKKADQWAAATDYDKEKYYDLLTNYASFVYDYGLYKDAEEIRLRQILMAEKLYGKEHENTATSYNNIGAVYTKQGDFFKALEYFFKALEIHEKVLGANHPDNAILYNNIGTVYHEQSDYSKALEYHSKALSIVEKNLSAGHPYTAILYNNIGAIYHNLGNYDKALDYLFKAVKIDEKVLGKEHPDTSISYDNIGSVYNDKGDYDKAIKYLFKALTIREKALGKEHPDTATSYNNIGSVYWKQGNYNEALDYYLKDLTIQVKSRQPNIAATYNNIGAVYWAQEECDKALEYYLKAVEIEEIFLGMEHPDTAASYNNIGVVYHHKGDYKKALVYFNKAYLILKKTLGPKHPNTKNVMDWINRIKKNLV